MYRSSDVTPHRSPTQIRIRFLAWCGSGSSKCSNSGEEKPGRSDEERYRQHHTWITSGWMHVCMEPPLPSLSTDVS